MTARNVPPEITSMATQIVLDLLPGRCPEWKEWQLFQRVTTALGQTGDQAVIDDVRRNLYSRGKHEYEVEAIEDVLMKHAARIAASQ